MCLPLAAKPLYSLETTETWAQKVSISVVTLHNTALAARRCFTRILRLLNLCDQKLECPSNVLVISSTGLGPSAVVPFCHLLPFLRADLSLLRPEITLVAYHNNRNPISALIFQSVPMQWFRSPDKTDKVIQYLLADDLYHFERWEGRNRVYQHVSMNADKMFGI